MKIEMFMRDIGNDAYIELTRSYSFLCQAVGCSFQNNILDTGLYHLSQIVLNIHGFRRCNMKACIQDFISYDCIHS